MPRISASGLTEIAVSIRMSDQRFPQILAFRIPSSRRDRIDTLQTLDYFALFGNRLVVSQPVRCATGRAFEELFLLCASDRAPDYSGRYQRTVFGPLEGISRNAEAHALRVPAEIDINTLERERQSALKSKVCRRYLREVVHVKTLKNLPKGAVQEGF
jgi:hypothetical protein